MPIVRLTSMHSATILLAAFVCSSDAFAVDNFVLTGSLANPRSGASAALVPGGKVLIAGGRGLSGATTSAELYDPATGQFAATGDMVAAYVLRTAAVLRSGKVLIAGGIDNGSRATVSAELYDPAIGQFAATGSLQTKRYFASATLLPDGNVLVVGGIDSTANTYLRSAELYDPAAGTFAATVGLMFGRAGATATLLPNGKVLIAGGGDSTNVFASAELYDPATGMFTLTGNLMTQPRARATATLLASGQVLIVGGSNDHVGTPLSTADIYNPASDTFTATGSLTTGRFLATATLLPDAKVLIAGGADPSNTDNSIASSELYDPATGMFTAAASLLVARQEATATRLGGLVLIVGGDDQDNAPLYNTELYIPNVIFRGAFEGP